MGGSLKANSFEGSGTAGSPYLIATSLDLINMKSFPNAHFRQTQDIAMDNMNPLDLPLFNYFDGVYDGGSHFLSNWSENNESANGLFGNTSEDAVIRNLIIDNAYLYYNNESSFFPIKRGILAADNQGLIEYVAVLRSKIEIFTADSTITVGGLVGANSGIIKRCVSCVSIVAECYYKAKAGGVAGNNSGIIEDCAMIGNSSFDDNTADIAVADNRMEYFDSRINSVKLGGIAGENMNIVRRCLSHFKGYVFPNATTNNFGAIASGDYGCEDCVSNYNHLGHGLKDLSNVPFYYYTYGDMVGGTDDSIYEFTGYDGYVDVSNEDAQPISGANWTDYWTLWQFPIHWTLDDIQAPYFNQDTSTYPSSWNFENVWTFKQDEKYFKILNMPYFPLIKIPVLVPKSNLFVKNNGTWKQGKAYVKASGVWKQSKEIIKLEG